MKESEEAPLVDPDQLSEWIIFEDQDLLVFDKTGLVGMSSIEKWAMVEPGRCS